jgi:hypothetical protein
VKDVDGKSIATDSDKEIALGRRRSRAQNKIKKEVRAQSNSEHIAVGIG